MAQAFRRQTVSRRDKTHWDCLILFPRAPFSEGEAGGGIDPSLIHDGQPPLQGSAMRAVRCAGLDGDLLLHRAPRADV